MVCCPDEVALLEAGLGLGFVDRIITCILQVCVEINLAETRCQISKSGLLSSSTASPKYFQTFEVVPGLSFSLSGVVSGKFGCGSAL